MAIIWFLRPHVDQINGFLERNTTWSEEATGSYRVVQSRSTEVVPAVPRQLVSELSARHQLHVEKTRRAHCSMRVAFQQKQNSKIAIGLSLKIAGASTSRKIYIVAASPGSGHVSNYTIVPGLTFLSVSSSVSRSSSPSSCSRSSVVGWFWWAVHAVKPGAPGLQSLAGSGEPSMPWSQGLQVFSRWLVLVSRPCREARGSRSSVVGWFWRAVKPGRRGPSPDRHHRVTEVSGLKSASDGPSSERYMSRHSCTSLSSCSWSRAHIPPCWSPWQGKSPRGDPGKGTFSGDQLQIKGTIIKYLTRTEVMDIILLLS